MQPIQTNREGKEKDLDNNKDEYKADSGPPGMEVDGVIESNWNEIADNFDEMNLREDLLRGIYAYGFEKPSAIQQRAIIPCIRGSDIIAKSQSSTGKTALFSISILQKLDLSIKNCQALILVPTRELAQQIRKVVLTLGDFMGVTCHACIGGITIRENLRILETGVQIMVGSPGRVSDLINRKALDPMTIKLIVVDEADEMLSRGFKEDIHYVFTKMPYNIQVMLSSSTLPSEVLELTKKFMREPIQF